MIMKCIKTMKYINITNKLLKNLETAQESHHVAVSRGDWEATRKRTGYRHVVFYSPNFQVHKFPKFRETTTKNTKYPEKVTLNDSKDNTVIIGQCNSNKS